MGSFVAMRPLAPALLLASSVLGVGCGGTAPREADIFHDPALRPGVVEAGGAEREILSRLGDEGLSTVTFGGRDYALEAPYDAASGRRCRGVVGAERRLACQNPDGSWVFVPDIVRSRSDR